MFISHSVAETEAFAAGIGQIVQAGCVIGLTGDLGAGKTQFVRGLARGLGASDRVHSPTFALLNIYNSGRLPLFHLDFYRLDTDEQIGKAGLDEYFFPPGVSVIEWVERWTGPRSADFLQIHFEILNETERRITH